MSIDKTLYQCEIDLEFSEGILKLDGFKFTDIGEIDVISRWLENHPQIHTLWLQDCNICTTRSVRSLHSSEEIRGISFVSTSLINQRLQILKADAIASLISRRDWIEINLGNNSLSPIESLKILKAITSSQSKLLLFN